MKPDELAVLYTVANVAYNSVSNTHKMVNPFYRALNQANKKLLILIDKEQALTSLELAYNEPTLPNISDVPYEKERIILEEIKNNFKKKVGGKTVYQMHIHIQEKFGVIVPIPIINNIRMEL